MGFTGRIVPLTLGRGGMSGAKNVAAVREDQLILADNLTFEDVTLRKEGGAAKYNSTAITGTPDILAGHDWDHDGSTQRSIVVTSAGAIIRDDGSGDYNGGTTLKSGLSVTTATVPVIVEGGAEVAVNDKKLFFFTGSNAVQVLDANGATTGDLATPPTDWSGSNQPKAGVVHEGRMWGMGNANDPHRTYYSLATNHEDFTSGDAGSLSIFPGEGEALVWGVSFRGVLILAKRPRGLYLVDTRDPSISNWKIRKITDAIGSPGVKAFTVIDNDVVFMSSSANIYQLSAVESLGDVGTASLSDTADFGSFIRDTADLSKLPNCVGVYYPAKSEVHFGFTQKGGSANDLRVVVDFNRPGDPRFRFSTRDDPISLWLQRDSDDIQRLTLGDGDGFVWNLDQETRSRDGEGYTGQFQTPHLDFSFVEPAIASVNKNWSFLELVVEPKGNHNIDVEVILDGAISEVLTYNMGVTGGTLGSFVLDTDKLAGSAIINRRQPITGRSRTLSILGSNGGIAEDFSVIKFIFGFKVSDTEEIV